MTIFVTSLLVSAYFKRLRRKITNGNDSRSLCGPVDGRGANTPPNLSNIHAFGAAKRFKCFLGPRAWRVKQKNSKFHLSRLCLCVTSQIALYTLQRNENKTKKFQIDDRTQFSNDSISGTLRPKFHTAKRLQISRSKRTEQKQIGTVLGRRYFNSEFNHRTDRIRTKYFDYPFYRDAMPLFGHKIVNFWWVFGPMIWNLKILSDYDTYHLESKKEKENSMETGYNEDVKRVKQFFFLVLERNVKFVNVDVARRRCWCDSGKFRRWNFESKILGWSRLDKEVPQ